jgi:hypothetical protein
VPRCLDICPDPDPANLAGCRNRLRLLVAAGYDRPGGHDSSLGLAEYGARNSGDLELVMAELTEDHEWDLTRSGIPGERPNWRSSRRRSSRSGASAERTTVQILSFEDGKVARTVVYGDLNEGRAAGGL